MVGFGARVCVIPTTYFDPPRSGSDPLQTEASEEAMKVTQSVIGGIDRMGNMVRYLDAASIPVDRLTRLLIRNLTVVINVDTGWAVLNAKPLCHRWLLHRMQKHPVHLFYEISTGDGWQSFQVPVAVAV